MPSAHGLTATELQQVVGELTAELTHADAGAEVQDAVQLADRDDLLLFLQTANGRRALHIAPGGNRARICLTRRRYARREFRTGPLADRLRELLVGRTITALTQPTKERRLTIELAGPRPQRLQIELFGSRGVWCVTDQDNTILELSRLPSGKRPLRPGDPYTPPPAGKPAPDVTSRFPEPCLAAIDDHFTALDRADELDRMRSRLERLVTTRAKKLTARVAGLQEQRRQAKQAPELRKRADMLLAYGFGLDAGQDSLSVPHPDEPDQQWTIAIEPGVPVQVQADKLYKRARKLEDGQQVSAQRQAEAELELQSLQEAQTDIKAAPDADALDLVAETLRQRGWAPAAPRPKAEKARAKKLTQGENFRSFRSVEGYTILVGRDNRQNDKLSTSASRGNDLWFHVGQGYAGSHVVVRLPKNKTASLETMLDAGTLAVHFSKARGAHRCDVTYTRCKHVRKPKGFPPGKVTVTQAKTLTIREDAERLQRLLDTLASE